MRIRTATLAAALAVLAAGCGNDKCPTESPEVTKLGNCTALAGDTVSYPIQLCPTCNQTLSSCEADLSDVGAGSGTIFLNPTVEACTSSSSCGTGCNLNPTTCTFRAPSAAGTYTVLAHDAAHPDAPKTGTLTVTATGATSCLL
jgi:hypothetical protein